MKLTNEQLLAALTAARDTALALEAQLKVLADADDGADLCGCISGMYDAQHIASNMDNNIAAMSKIAEEP